MILSKYTHAAHPPRSCGAEDAVPPIHISEHSLEAFSDERTETVNASSSHVLAVHSLVGEGTFLEKEKLVVFALFIRLEADRHCPLTKMLLFLALHQAKKDN